MRRGRAASTSTSTTPSRRSTPQPSTPAPGPKRASNKLLLGGSGGGMRVHAIVADLDTARLAVAAGATVIQLRVKASTAEVVERGRAFGELGATFVVNDDIDAAFELGADGVHLGQFDKG